MVEEPNEVQFRVPEAVSLAKKMVAYARLKASKGPLELTIPQSFLVSDNG